MRVPQFTVARLIAFADAVQLAGFIPGKVTYLFIAISVALKVLILIAFTSRFRFDARTQLFGVIYLVVSYISALANSDISFEPVAQSLAITVSIGVTIGFLATDKALTQYLRVFTRCGTILFVIYLIYLKLGKLDDNFGRFYFFGDYQPDTGAEVAAALAITSLMVLPKVESVLSFSLFFASMAFMQGRASMLTAAAGVFLFFVPVFTRNFRRNPVATLTVTIASLGAIGIFAIETITNVVSSLLLLDDSYRGADSGFSGRAGLWDVAQDLINQGPWVGNGPDIYQRNGLLVPHNFFLLGFVTLGSLFIILLGYLCYLCTRAYKADKRKVRILSSFLFMMMFNAKFISASAYPYIGFIIILSLAQRDSLRPQGSVVHIPTEPVTA